MKQKLYLFTDTFPYGYGETFLADEYPYLEGAFEEIQLLPLFHVDTDGEPLDPGSPQRKVLTEKASPLLSCNPKNKGALLLQGIFNLSPIHFIFREFFQKKVWKSPARMRMLMTYGLLTRALLAGKSYKALYKSLKEEKGTRGLLYFYWGDRAILLLPFLKKALPSGYRVIARFHGSDLYEEVKGFLPFRKSILSAIDIAFPISENGHIYLEKRYPGLLQEIRTRHLGSSGPEKEKPYLEEEDEVLRLLSVSNIIPLKRVEMIAEALLSLQEEDLKELPFKKIRWTHIGEGERRGSIEEQILSRLSESPLLADILEIEFTGKMQHEDLMRFLGSHHFDLFLNTSTTEGIPVSIMEAISFGIPVLATDVGGVREIIRDCGRLLPADLNAGSLKEALLEFARLEPAHRKEMREKSRQAWSAHWDKSKNYPEFIHEITGLIGHGSVTSRK